MSRTSVKTAFIVFSHPSLLFISFAMELHNLSSRNGLSYYQSINLVDNSDKGNFEPENFWQSSGNASIQVNHDNLSSTLDTLRSFLSAMKKERQNQELMSDRNMTTLVNYLKRLSEANIDLLGQQGQIAEEDRNLLANSKSSKKKHVLQYSSRTLDGSCGGTTALGIFNFLTFVVYAFSLLVVLVQLVSGSMANSLSGTFLPDVLSILQQGRRIRELGGPWDVLSRHFENSIFKKLSGNLPKSYMEEESTLGLITRNFKISQFKRSSRNIQTPHLAKDMRLLENEMGSELIMTLLTISGVQVDVMKCISPLYKTSHKYFNREPPLRPNPTIF